MGRDMSSKEQVDYLWTVVHVRITRSRDPDCCLTQFGCTIIGFKSIFSFICRYIFQNCTLSFLEQCKSIDSRYICIEFQQQSNVYVSRSTEQHINHIHIKYNNNIDYVCIMRVALSMEESQTFLYGLQLSSHYYRQPFASCQPQNRLVHRVLIQYSASRLVQHGHSQISRRFRKSAMSFYICIILHYNNKLENLHNTRWTYSIVLQCILIFHNSYLY